LIVLFNFLLPYAMSYRVFCESGACLREAPRVFRDTSRNRPLRLQSAAKQ